MTDGGGATLPNLDDDAPLTKPPLAKPAPLLPDRAAAPRPGSRRRLPGNGDPAAVAWAWLVLLAERLWPMLWPLAALAGLFLAVALFDILPVLPGWLHLGLLIVGAVVAMGVLGRTVLQLGLPSRHAARRRVETDSGLAHRPLSTARDAQALGTDDPESRRLWHLHHDRQRNRLGRLRAAVPALGLVDHDPYALRGIVLLLVAIAVIGTPGDWAGRLDRAVSPTLAVAAPPPPSVLDLYISPPAHTGRVPILLAAGLEVGDGSPVSAPAVPQDAEPDAAAADAPGAVVVPEGSEIIVRLSRPAGRAHLAIDDIRVPLEPSADGAQAALTHTLGVGTRLAVIDDGREVAAWPIKLLLDLAPRAWVDDPPAVGRRGALGIDWRASDDYGVAAVTGTIEIDAAAPPALDRMPITFDLAVAPDRPATAEGRSFRDLTPHPWAGQTVHLTLEAEDAAGQTGRSATVTLTLPERTFDHLIARAIIDQRRRLLLDPDGTWVEVAESLATLRLRPERFDDDRAAYLALVTAARRLMLAEPGDRPTLTAVEALLWDTALAIEDGGLSLAERDLREAQEALRDALARGASNDEIARLMEDLRQAMDAYMAAVQQDMMERLAEGESVPMLPPDASVIDQQQMRDYLSQMQALAEMGARDQAMAMLDQLQAMTESLQGGMMAMPPQAGAAMDLIEDLQALMQAQQALRDQTYRRSQRQPWEAVPEQRDGDGAPMTGDQAAAVQEGLRQALRDAMRRMGEMSGEIPGGLGDAERAMRGAEGALGDGRPGDALGPQGEALDGLREGLQSFVDTMREQMGGAAFGAATQPGGLGRDPLGRENGDQGLFSTGGVDLPDRRAMQRAREIVDQLRRRLNDRRRPRIEQEYFERLLDRF